MELKVPIVEYLPAWDQFGPAAGPKRNAQIVARANAVVAFPGSGRGTWDTIRRAQQKGIPLIIDRIE